MNLREVREAADRVTRFKFNNVFTDSRVMGQHILATIDPEPDSPITAEWLREEWGADLSLYRIGNINGSFYIDSDGYLVWKHVGNETARLTTRQQFCDLARCLGIPCNYGMVEIG